MAFLEVHDKQHLLFTLVAMVLLEWLLYHRSGYEDYLIKTGRAVTLGTYLTTKTRHCQLYLQHPQQSPYTREEKDNRNLANTLK
jgi:hypothetical protein